LEHWLKIVISSPLVLQSRFLYEKLEISETESNNLMQYGQYLRALVRMTSLPSSSSSSNLGHLHSSPSASGEAIGDG